MGILGDRAVWMVVSFTAVLLVFWCGKLSSSAMRTILRPFDEGWTLLMLLSWDMRSESGSVGPVWGATRKGCTWFMVDQSSQKWIRIFTFSVQNEKADLKVFGRSSRTAPLLGECAVEWVVWRFTDSLLAVEGLLIWQGLIEGTGMRFTRTWMRSRLVALVAFLVLGVFMIVSCWIDMRHETRASTSLSQNAFSFFGCLLTVNWMAGSCNG